MIWTFQNRSAQREKARHSPVPGDSSRYSLHLSQRRQQQRRLPTTHLAHNHRQLTWERRRHSQVMVLRENRIEKQVRDMSDAHQKESWCPRWKVSAARRSRWSNRCLSEESNRTDGFRCQTEIKSRWKMQTVIREVIWSQCDRLMLCSHVSEILWVTFRELIDQATRRSLTFYRDLKLSLKDKVPTFH